MKSSVIRDKHTFEYQTFFSRNMMIFSLPCWFNIAGDIQGDEVIHIKQKLPLRMYIGLNVSSKPGVRLKHFRSYSHVRDKFITREVHEYIPFVESWLQKIQEHYPAEAGIDVSILSEAGRHVGLGVSPLILFTLFLARKYMDDSDIFKKVLKESQKPLTTINSDTSITNILLREYLQLMQKMHTPHEAFGIATSIFHVAHPCVFMGKHLNSAQKKPNLYGFSIFDFLSDDIGDPFGSTETTIVYSGCHLFSEKTPHLERRKHPSIQKIQSLMHDILSDHDIPYNETQIPDFLTKGGDFSDSTLNISNQNFQTYQSIQILDTLIQSYKQHHPYAVRDFLSSLNRYAHSQTLLYGESAEMGAMAHDIQSAFRGDSELPAIYPNETAMTGGCFTIISPVGKHQDIIRGLTQQLRGSHRECATLYRSWKDGHEKIGFTIEQDITEGHYSEMTDRNIGICYKRDEQYVLARSELLEFSHGKIICDLDMAKIYCDGKILTSAQLPSQKAAIEVLKALRTSETGKIQNTLLTRSTYSKSKNEMQGKIAGPLNRLSLEHLGKPFPLDLEGGIEEFTIIFTPTDNPDVVFFYK